MDDAALKSALAAVWDAYRKAMREYRLDELRALADLPPDLPIPPRAQLQALGEGLPDLGKLPCLALRREGDLAGFYADLSEPGGTEVAVVRFRSSGGAWKPLPPPHTMSWVSVDQPRDKAEMIASEPSLRLTPPGAEPHPPPPTAPQSEEDARPDEAIRTDLETLWGKIRAGLAMGTIDGAIRLPEEAGPPPSAEELRTYAAQMPDLARARFLRLLRRPDKPRLLGYLAALPGRAPSKRSIALVVFARAGNAWTFTPGPASVEQIEVEAAEAEDVDALLRHHPELRL